METLLAFLGGAGWVLTAALIVVNNTLNRELKFWGDKYVRMEAQYMKQSSLVADMLKTTGEME